MLLLYFLQHRHLDESEYLWHPVCRRSGPRLKYPRMVSACSNDEDEDENHADVYQFRNESLRGDVDDGDDDDDDGGDHGMEDEDDTSNDSMGDSDVFEENEDDIENDSNQASHT